jgi:hypothetical protein
MTGYVVFVHDEPVGTFLSRKDAEKYVSDLNRSEEVLYYQSRISRLEGLLPRVSDLDLYLEIALEILELRRLLGK